MHGCGAGTDTLVSEDEATQTSPGAPTAHSRSLRDGGALLRGTSVGDAVWHWSFWWCLRLTQFPTETWGEPPDVETAPCRDPHCTPSRGPRGLSTAGVQTGSQPPGRPPQPLLPSPPSCSGSGLGVSCLGVGARLLIALIQEHHWLTQTNRGPPVSVPAVPCSELFPVTVLLVGDPRTQLLPSPKGGSKAMPGLSLRGHTQSLPLSRLDLSLQTQPPCPWPGAGLAQIAAVWGLGPDPTLPGHMFQATAL